MTTDIRVDAYIESAPPFAQPIIKHIRKLMHKASPHITETIKWGVPFFEYKGVIGGIAAFKQHCAFNFMKAKLMSNLVQFEKGNAEAKGHLGKITSVADLPSDAEFMAYIQEAMLLNENKQTVERKKPPQSREITIAEDVQNQLAQNSAAQTFFTSLSYSQKKEYINWVEEAKTEATRLKRLHTMIEWLAEGKTRNWKYEKV